MEDHQEEYKVILEEGFPTLVEGLVEFFDEECSNEIVRYKPDMNIIEPAYCKDGRVRHNRNVGTSRISHKVVRDYNILSLQKGENGINQIILTIWLGEETIPEEDTSFDFDMFRYKGEDFACAKSGFLQGNFVSGQKTSPPLVSNPIRRLEEKVRNLSLEEKVQKRKNLPKQIQDLVWTKYEPPNSTIGICYCCKGDIRLVPRTYECGHVISRYNGGSDYISNLRPICLSCNRSMGTRNMDEYMTSYGFDKTNEECFLTL